MLTTVGLGVIVMAGSIAVMIAILRRAPSVPYLAIFTGVCAVVFFLRIPTFTIAGTIASLVGVAVGTFLAVARRRSKRLIVPAKGRVLRLHTGEYLSESGHWRRAS